MPARTPRLVLFSGLGISPRLLLPQTTIPARVERPDWIPFDEHESLAQYSRRLASTIDPTGPLYIGGVSLGGMVALEAATVLQPRGVFLIAACRSGQSFSRLLKATLRATTLTPLPVLELMQNLTPLLVRMVGKPDRRQRDFLLDLALTSDVRMTRWGGNAMLNWTAPPCECPAWHIHGSADRLIPLENVHPDAVIPGGGHVINVTHGAVVNAYISERMLSLP